MEPGNQDAQKIKDRGNFNSEITAFWSHGGGSSAQAFCPLMAGYASFVMFWRDMSLLQVQSQLSSLHHTSGLWGGIRLSGLFMEESSGAVSEPC